MSSDSIVIVAAKRTPIGAFQGALSGATATELGAAAVAAALDAADIDPALVSEVLMGCVLPAGLGQAPARQAALVPEPGDAGLGQRGQRLMQRIFAPTGQVLQLPYVPRRSLVRAEHQVVATKAEQLAGVVPGATEPLGELESTQA